MIGVSTMLANFAKRRILRVYFTPRKSVWSNGSTLRGRKQRTGVGAVRSPRQLHPPAKLSPIEVIQKIVSHRRLVAVRKRGTAEHSVEIGGIWRGRFGILRLFRRAGPRDSRAP